MNTIDFSKHDIGIFIKDTWQKYAGAIRTLIRKIKIIIRNGAKTISPPNFVWET
jgi:uncharacterized protein (DUF736 family)